MPLYLLPKDQRHIASGFLQQLTAANADLAAKLQTLQQVNQQTASHPGGEKGGKEGVNDGLGSISGIVSGVSGATLGNSHFVLIAGLTGMVASALSMGSGAYPAAKSEREIYEAEFARERQAVEDNEAEGREVLSLSYQIRGLPEEDAQRFVDLKRSKGIFNPSMTKSLLGSAGK